MGRPIGKSGRVWGSRRRRPPAGGVVLSATLFAALHVAVDEQTPSDRDLHLILDNYATHKHPKGKAWLAKHPRFLTTRRLRRGVFHSLPELIEAITAYLANYNASPTPFVWTATASEILANVKRARRKLHTPR